MSKGGSTTVKDNSTSAVQLPQWMSDAGKSLFDKSMADSAASPVTAYKGELSAPMDANQKSALSQAKSTSNTGQSQIAAGQQAVSAGTAKGDRVSTSNFDQAAANKYMSPFLSAVQGRTVADMARTGDMQLDSLGDSAAANHAYGGTREAVAQAEATKGINNNILDYLARSNEAGYENAQGQFNTDTDRQLGAATTNAGLTQSELDRKIAAGAAMGNLGQQASGVNAEGISNLLKTGTVAQQTQDAADQAKYQEALRVQDGTVNRDEDLMAILAGTPRNVTTQNTGTQKTTSNPGWLNTALGVGGMAASIYSDERLKRDIVHVGTLEDGLPVIDFNYRDGMGLPEGRFRGVRAQDVARFRPHALGPTVNGYATVDYARLEDHR
jgi:hypothetical protein